MDALTREPAIAEPPGRSRRWRTVLLCLLATAAIGAGIWYWPVAAPDQKAAGGRDQNEFVPVVQAISERRDMPLWLDGLGTVQAFQTVTVRSMVDGPLVSVDFKEGQEVRAGDILARIDPRIYQAALDNAVAKKALDEANLANARLDLTRYQKLVATNYATQQQADTQRAMVAQLEAQVRQDQAQIDTAKTQLSYTDIVSPIAGRVGIRLVDMGNIVHAADAGGLLVITQLQPISVVFSLPQQNLPLVAAAMTMGTAEVVAYAQGTGVVDPLDTGTLTVLDNQIDQTTGTIKLKATFPNAAGKLWPGGFVGVRLRVDTVRDATVVPRAAVQRGPRQSFVYAIDDDGTVHRQNITVGNEDELGSIVTGGIGPGVRVVVDGASRLTDGAKVSVVAPQADPRPISADRPAAPGARRRDGSAQGG
jgi:multidrug efflux system membrane fusion protein